MAIISRFGYGRCTKRSGSGSQCGRVDMISRGFSRQGSPRAPHAMAMNVRRNIHLFVAVLVDFSQLETNDRMNPLTYFSLLLTQICTCTEIKLMFLYIFSTNYNYVPFNFFFFLLNQSQHVFNHFHFLNTCIHLIMVYFGTTVVYFYFYSTLFKNTTQY